MKRKEWKRVAPLGLVMLFSLTACSAGDVVEEDEGTMTRGRTMETESPWTEEGMEPWDVWDPWEEPSTGEHLGEDVKSGMDDMGEDVKSGFDDLGRDVKDGVEDVKDGVEDVGKDGEEVWDEMKKDTGEGWDDIGERTGVSDWDGVLTEDGRMVVPEDGMLEEGISGVDPAFTGVEPGSMNFSGLSASVEKESVAVAGWSEMVGHSHYRATKRGNVYDPAGTEYQVKDLWEEARRTIDDMGEDFSRAVNDIGKGERV